MNHAHLAVGAVVLQAFSQDALVLPHQGVPALVGEGGGGGVWREWKSFIGGKKRKTAPLRITRLPL